MFGLVRAKKSEMRFKDYDTYKALYCTLCKTLGKRYGRLSRLLLDYDMVFMLMLGMSVEETPVCYHKKCCTSNPLKKCYYCEGEQPIIEYSAAVLMLLSEAKVRDNKADSKGVKKLLWSSVYPWFKRKKKKAAALYPSAAKTVDTYIEEQWAVEKGDFKGIDAAAEPTSKALSSLFSEMAKDQNNKRIFENIGYLLGKWIYIADAALDSEKDIKKGNYNPLVLMGGEKTVKEKAKPLLNTCEVLISNAFNLLEIKKYKPILENIIYFGFDEVQKIVFRENEK